VDERDQIDAFAVELDSLMDRFTQEFDVSYASLIGVLQMKVVHLSVDGLFSDDLDDDGFGPS
jgi:hypothetical protein